MPMPKGWKKHDGYDWKAFGDWIHASRKAAEWTLSKLGEQLGIKNKGTIARIERGGQGLPPEQRERVVSVLAAALPPDPARPSRRELIKVAGLTLAGLELAGRELPQPPTSAPSAETPARQVRTRERDERAVNERAMLEDCIFTLGVSLTATWDVDLLHGHPQLVADRAEVPYRLLTTSPFLGDSEFALTAIRIGIRRVRAKEAILDWFKRSATVIEAYTDIEERIILRFAGQLDKQPAIMREYAQLLARRGVLYRGLSLHREAERDLRQSIMLAQRVNDPLLQIDGHCELAHMWIGRGNQGTWKEELEQARNVARLAPAGQQGDLFALITYFEGAQQRRLAFDEIFALPESVKIQKAEQAIRNMRLSRQQLGDNWSKYVLQGSDAGHPLNTLVSEAQCYIWTEPERVTQELESLKSQIAVEFPGLMGKIAIAESWPAIRSSWRAHNGLPFFDLSGKRDAHGKVKPRFRP